MMTKRSIEIEIFKWCSNPGFFTCGGMSQVVSELPQDCNQDISLRLSIGCKHMFLKRNTRCLCYGKHVYLSYNPVYWYRTQTGIYLFAKPREISYHCIFEQASSLMRYISGLFSFSCHIAFLVVYVHIFSSDVVA